MVNILVTLNANYLQALRVMLKSLFVNNPHENITVYLMYSDIPSGDVAGLQRFVDREGHRFVPLRVRDDLFADALVLRHYTKEMYYRLAAHLYLPEEVDRILYLDPDIVVINPVSEFYRTPFDNCLFVAAEHRPVVRMTLTFNRLRLRTPKAKGYFNTGVLLMNVDLMRREMDLGDVFRFLRENWHRLILPDQDVLNALYWDRIKPADGFLYNFDARYYEFFKLIPKHKINMRWIEENTVFIHYCGKRKPWHKTYRDELGRFYRQYESMLETQPSETLA